MPKVQYIVKGTPLKDVDVDAQILAFLSEFGLEGAIKQKADGFVLHAKGNSQSIKRFEKELLQKLITLFDLQSYTKKVAEPTPKTIKNHQVSEGKSDIQIAAELLRKSKILAVKSPNGYHLICHASKIPAIKALRQIIHDHRSPLSVMFKSIISAQKLILLSQKEKERLAANDRPIIVAKLKTLHQMERNKYKYTLSGYINPVNKRIPVSLPSSPFYEALFQEIQFPIVSIDATTKSGEMITDRNILDARYPDAFAYIIEDTVIQPSAQPREVYQFIYGTLKPYYPSCETDADVILDLSQSRFFDYSLAPLKILLDDNRHPQPLLSALSLLFAHMPPEEITALTLPLSKEEIFARHQQWQHNQNTTVSSSLITYFDAIAGLSGVLHQKQLALESVMMAEAYFEVCEEELFEYEISDHTITLDIVTDFCKNKKPKHLFSTLINTISTLIAKLAKDMHKTDVDLCGTLFSNRDLTELTIEKLMEKKIKCHI